MENDAFNSQYSNSQYSGGFIDDKPQIPAREAAFAWGMFALSFIFTHCCVPHFGGLWGGIFWSVFGVLIAVYAKINSIKFSKFHVVMLAAAEVFCLTPLFSADRFVCFLAAVYSFALYFYLMIAATGAEAFGKHFVLDFVRAILIRPFESFAKQPVCAFSVFKGKKRTKNVLYALLGLAISVPLTVVVVMLLASSDDTFDSVIGKIADILPNISFDLVWEIIFAVPIAMYLFGAVFSMKKDAPDYQIGVPEYRFLPAVIAYFAVSPICVFYLIYVIVQVGNIFNALGKNIGYADFARQGFFELCAISVINLGVIVLLQTFSKRNENDEKPLVLRIYSVMISVFTLLIIATALTKMFMYIGQYGMTLLRVYTSWFMLLLAVVFVLIIALQIRDYPIWKALFAAFTLMFAALCFGNFEGNIAAYNIAAYQSGALDGLDVGQFNELGVAAVSPAYKLYRECDNEELKIRLGYFIESEKSYDNEIPRFAYFSVPRAMAWSAFNETKGEKLPDTVRVVVDVESSGVYGLRSEFFLGYARTSGQFMENARGGPISVGEKLIFELTEEDLGDFGFVELSNETLGVYFHVLNKRGKEIRPNVPEGWINSYESYDGADYSLSERCYEDGDTPELLWEWKAVPGGEYEFVLCENGAGGYCLEPVY